MTDVIDLQELRRLEALGRAALKLGAALVYNNVGRHWRRDYTPSAGEVWARNDELRAILAAEQEAFLDAYRAYWDSRRTPETKARWAEISAFRASRADDPRVLGVEEWLEAFEKWRDG